jgi:hypothetical protein
VLSYQPSSTKKSVEAVPVYAGMLIVVESFAEPVDVRRPCFLSPKLLPAEATMTLPGPTRPWSPTSRSLWPSCGPRFVDRDRFTTAGQPSANALWKT